VIYLEGEVEELKLKRKRMSMVSPARHRVNQALRNSMPPDETKEKKEKLV